MKACCCRTFASFSWLCLPVRTTFAQSSVTVLVLRFQNNSSYAELNWVGEHRRNAARRSV